MSRSNDNVITCEDRLLSFSPSDVSPLPPSTRVRSQPVLALSRVEAGHDKEVKRGYRSFSTPKVCGVSFERFPAWLWVLRVMDWSHILITSVDESRIRQNHPTTFGKYGNRWKVFDVDEIHQLPIVDEACVWWVSGGMEFVNSVRLPPHVPSVSWITSAPRRSPRDEAPSHQWLSVSHSKVGGSTTARGVFRLIGVDPITIPSDLTRTISHIIKFSIKSTPCSPVPKIPHYTLRSKLSVAMLNRPVVVPSDFSATGWGMRTLEPSELAVSYELPDWVPWEHEFQRFLVPLQILRAIMDQVFESVAPTQGEGRSTRQRRTESAVVSKSMRDITWLADVKRWLPGTWAEGEIADKAVKSDDASVNMLPWHRRITLLFPCNTATLMGMTMFLMRRWRRNIFRSFFAYLSREYGREWPSRLTENRRKRSLSTADDGSFHSKAYGGKGGMRFLVHNKGDSWSELIKDLIVGLPILGQVSKSTWWEWTTGSSLFFWRWVGLEQIRAARDGMRVFVSGPLPRSRHMKPLRITDEQSKMVFEKVEGMIHRSYLSRGFVKSSLHFFAVPKGPTDIRIVYDGTSCGLNEAIWAPNFYLPTSRAASVLLSFSSWLADADFGEMFHNFTMEERIRKHSGVDLSLLKGREATKLRWNRLFMGMRASPYNAVRHYYWGEDFARGNPRKKGNPMGYNRVRLNLPGCEDYDPLLPKVMKWTDGFKEGEPGTIAGDVITFVDDVRIVGHSKENCHEVHRQFTSRMQYLGMQDAPRKFRAPSQNAAGAWTGTIFRVTQDQISKSVSVEKWTKGLTILCAIRDACDAHAEGRPSFDRKQLERDTGFLNHLSMTFDETIPYLKGFYLTLNSWRPHRDDHDWKVTDRAWRQILVDRVERGITTIEDADVELGHREAAPELVMGSPRLSSDVNALLSILGGDGPPLVQLRSKTIISVVFGFGDASGTGLGATFTCGSGFTFQIGVWGSLEADESSNWKEFTNVVESLEEEGRLGNLDQAEVFMFTDNSTVESCSHKGSSSSPKLLSLIIRLRAMSMKHGSHLHIFHVAGTRMIAQGTDGVSRGFLAQGIMAGDPMISFIPIHLSALDRSPTLEPWLRSWCGKESLMLSPDDWFQEGQDIAEWASTPGELFEHPVLKEGRTYVWAPPPFAADVAMSELRKARIKRQTSSHVFVCPRLCCSLWVKQLNRACDFVFQVLPDSEVWPSAMHEPLLIGIAFPFLRVKPWQLRGCPKMHAVARQLRDLQSNKEVDRRDILWKFWTQCHGLRNMPENVVRKVLYFDGNS